MVNVYITSVGIDKVRKTMFRLPSSMEWELDKGITEFARAVQKSAKLRAPRSTGFLADQIKVEKTKKGYVSITTGQAYYALAQEMGYKPHWIPVQYFERHRRSPNVPGGAMGRVVNPTWPRGQVSKHKPFMRPAIVANVPKLPSYVGRIIEKAYAKARR